ncbi:EamA family transporter [Microbacterium hominis]|uniref:Multidrug transporter n=1 Tax=Microbacterium hominis TaxID=162426 RepID=A0A0B4CVY5_9MICO|nr:EamA family transporter [Microbacterium hominis]KIC58501.1 multidrug transporter [Microbacterium hominis]
MSRPLSIAAVLVAALCFATTGTSRALADVDADALSIGAARVLIGGGLLGAIAIAIALVARSGRTAAPHVETGRARQTVSTFVIVLVGAAGVLAYQPTFFSGTGLNGVAVGTVVALGSAPIVTGVLDSVLRRRRPSLRWSLATTVAIVGVVLVSGVVGDGAAAPASALGVAASVGAGASYALYAIASKMLLDRGWTAPAAMGAVFGTAAMLSLPVLLSTSTAWLGTADGAALALWLGVVTVTIAYLLFGAGLRGLSPATVSTLTLAEPLAATVLGLVVVHEQLSAVSVAGLIVIAVGLVLVAAPVRARSDGVSAPA